MEWWAGLTGINQFFFGAAFVFSFIFIWQLVMALLGLGGASDVTSHVDAFDHSALDHSADSDAADTVASFKLIGVRSVLAFLTMFFWASALYFGAYPLGIVMLIACAWGMAAMFLVAWIFHMLMKMTETGNLKLATAVGGDGVVYMNIPERGVGEVRVMVSGVMTHVRAHTRDGAALKAGSRIKVTKLLDAGTLEVIPDDAHE